MTPEERFADSVKDYEAWAADGQDEGLIAVRNGSRIIAQLYAAGLELPPLPDDVNRSVGPSTVTIEEWQRVREKAARLPLQHYSEVFNPLMLPGEEPLVGDITDDVADIYRDVVPALRLFENGQRDESIWNWVFLLRWHWGEHAVSAIRVLYWYLREHSDNGTAHA